MATIHRLANGITCVCEERPGSGLVAMQVLLDFGTADDAADEHGLTNLMHSACNTGTATLSRKDISEFMENRGAIFSGQVGTEQSSFSGEVKTEDTADFFKILSDIIRNPSFAPTELAHEKWIISQNLDASSKKPNYISRKLLLEALFGDHPAGRDSFGEKDLVLNFTPAQVREKHRQMLARSDKMVISFAGDIDNATAQKLVDEHFGDMQPSAMTPREKIQFAGRDLRHALGQKQMDLALAFEAPNKGDMERFNFVILETLLSGGLSSPLMQEIREKRGLVYGVGASYTNRKDTGIFSIHAQSGADMRELIKTTLTLLGDTARDGFTEEKLNKARESVMRSIFCAMEKGSAVCDRNASSIANYGLIRSTRDFEDKLKQVTSDGIRQSIAAMLQKGKYALAGVGPMETMPTEQEIKDMIAHQSARMPVLPRHVPSDSPSSITQVFAAAHRGPFTPGKAPQVTVLANGITVVTDERPDSSLSCGAWGNAGSDHETAETNGAAHMIEHMRFKGTKSYAPGTIEPLVEQQLGGKLNAYTGPDRVAYYLFNLMGEHLEQAVDICGEMVFEATMDEVEYSGGKVLTNPDGTTEISSGERSVVLEEIKKYQDQSSFQMGVLLNKIAYRDQSSGRHVLGTPQSLLGMTAADLKKFCDEYYPCNSFTFCAAGPVRHEDHVAIVEKKFGHLKPGEIKPLPKPVYYGGTDFMEFPSVSLCEFRIGAEGVTETDPDYYAYNMLASVLGSGETSRLTSELVIKQTLAPGIGAASSSLRNRGMFIMGGAVEPANAKILFSKAYAELRRLCEDLTEGELAKIKSQMAIGLLKTLETSKAANDAYGRSSLTHDGRPMTPAEFTAKVQAVTVEDVKRAAKRVLESNPAVAMIVPPGTDPSLLPHHREVLAMRDGTWAPAQTIQPVPVSPVATPG